MGGVIEVVAMLTVIVVVSMSQRIVDHITVI